MPQALADRLVELGSCAWNVYGPTETTIWSTAKLLSHNSPVNIGAPLANTQIYILDLHENPVPTGTAGELYIGGVGVARGYLNQPELTAERFLPDPFSRKPGARLYKTGDLARWLPDGNIEFLGRIDHQVKVRGFRIELGEIETVLNGHSAVSASAVLAQGEGVDKVLVAYLVSRPDMELSAPALREWAAAKLPDYMVPARFVQVAALPINVNGKLDRKALSQMSGQQLAAGLEYVAPRNELEQQLATIWQTVLRRQPIGVHDNFFHLGGHSLLAISTVSHLQRQTGIALPLRLLFEHPTIERLASQLTTLKGNPANRLVIERVDRQQPLSLSYGQQGMWLLQQTLPDAATYNQPVAWRFTGHVDMARLQQALQLIQDRHEVLRTALVHTGEALVQHIIPADELQISWRVMDLSAATSDQRQAILEAQLLTEVRQVFDLAQAPLWRAAWLKLAAEEHVLALTFHHSVLDEWSLRQFCRELAGIYDALEQGQTAPLPELAVQYADYAAWQRQQLSGTLLESRQAYWREQLRDLTPALELPVDRPRPPQASGRGAVHAFKLKAATVTGMRNLTRAEGTTLFTVMLTAYQVWLHRYTGQTDIVVGSPLARRELPEVESVFGYFLNTLPIRARLEGKLSFKEALQQVRTTVLEGIKHADLPFEQMVELAGSSREAGQQPLYQTMFVLLEEGVSSLTLGAVPSHPLAVHTGTSKNDLLLSVLAEGDEWQCEFEYATDILDASTVARMAEHWQELLCSISQNQECPLSQLNLLPARERQQILVQWNATEREYPSDKCVHQLFEEQVARTPEAIAVVYEQQSLTYRELNQRANQLAHYLRKQGVGPDHLVALFLDRSLEMVITLLGILKAGGAYVPLDPTLPKQRLAALLAQTASNLVVTGKVLAEALQESIAASEVSISIVVWESIQSDLKREAVENATIISTPSHLAYVLFTSGSTGQPKGVQMPHQALTNLLIWQCAISRMGYGHRTLQFASLGFDVSFQEIFSTWVSGGTLLLINDEVRTNPVELASFISSAGINRVFLPYIMLEQMAVSWESQNLTCLQEVAVAGEQLRVSPSMRRFFDKIPNCRFWNHYGPTETHVVTSWELSGTATGWPDLPSIGRPLPNCQIYLLDENLNPAALGLTGGLYIGGDCLARGYLNQPELTAERFLPDPFSRKPGARLYKTGDLARWLPDGNIEFLGRIDHQVKVRGFRIELGEIETVLNGHSAVSASAVLAQGEGVDKVLVAYLVSRPDMELSAPALREWAAAKLPDYMVPARFVQVAALPINVNGKLDRKALSQMSGQQLAAGLEYVAPRNELEQQLATIWQTVLRRQPIGVHDNFFHLGGHSLLAVQMAAEIKKQFAHELPIATLFQSPTVASLAQRLADESWSPAWRSIVPLKPQGTHPPLFFVHGWGGEVFGFLKLVKLMPTDLPCYGIQAVGLDGKTARHTSVEEMGAFYVQEIIKFRPNGSIYLAGYSMGGNIACEVARQLLKQGRRVAMVALIDSYPVGRIPWVFYVWPMFSRIAHHIKQWSKMPTRERFVYLAGRWKAFTYVVNKNRSKKGPEIIVAPTTTEKPKVPGFEDYYYAIASKHQLVPFSGPADAFFTEHEKVQWRWYWRYLARGGVRFHRLTGAHLQLLSHPEHLPFLADALTKVLRQRQQENEELK